MATAKEKEALAKLSFDGPPIDPHFLAAPAVLRQLQVDTNEGLSADQVSIRRQAFGPNMLKGAKAVHPVVILMGHLFNVMTCILFLALGMSLATHEYIEAGVILFVIITNATVGFFQEYRSEQTMAALRRLSCPTARVIREGTTKVVPADDLVLGDIVLMEDGDSCPADIRILDCVAFAMEEAILTGESVPVNKDPSVLEVQSDCPLGDRKNMTYFGCIVTRGRATGVVVATGMSTELGKIARSIGEKTDSKTPLQRALDRLSIALFVAAVILGVVVIGINKMQLNHEVLQYAIALGVSIIPEGLVAVVTVALSIGVKNMAQANTIVRKLVALEALGAVTDICSDKTGTLTLAKMVATKMWLAPDTIVDIGGRGINPHHMKSFKVEGREVQPANLDTHAKDVLTVCSLCNTSTINPPSEGNPQVDEWTAVGDPTEIALTVLAHKAGMTKDTLLASGKYGFVNEYPFDSTIKRMSVVYNYKSDGETRQLVLAKGALESIFKICNRIQVGSEILPLERPGASGSASSSPWDLKALQARVELLACHGLRVLALAHKTVPSSTINSETPREDVEGGMVLLGLVGMYDPPRPETLGAVRVCREAGITVRMVTGDHPRTAAAIGQQVEILPTSNGNRTRIGGGEGITMTASEFDSMTEAEIDRKAYLPNVVARCSPATKVNLIDALHRRGCVVAMTGDGVNDCPSLKRADVGIAMGMNGSDVTKQAADLVLTDDNFATITAAVKEGRRISSNIVKFVIHLMTANVGEVITLMCGLAFFDADGLSVYPMSPLQILWVNMVTSSPPALGLAAEAAEANIMKEEPRGRTSILLNTVVFADTLAYGFVMGMLALANFIVVAFWFGEGTSHTHLCNYVMSDECEHLYRARGACFATTTALLLIHAYNCKDLKLSLTQMNLTDNRMLLYTVIFGFITMVPLFYIPGVNANIFLQGALTWEWILVLISMVLFVAFSELYKKFMRPIIVEKDKAKRKAAKIKRSADVDAGGIQLVVVAQ